MSIYLDYTPNIIGAAVTFATGATVCAVVITVWMFSFSRLPALSFKSKDLASRVILKTVPLLAGLLIMIPVTGNTLSFLRIGSFSEPAIYYLGVAFNPITLVVIGALHLFLTRPRSD